MTRLAVLSDIHGNADALAAVLRDVESQSPDAIINLGDCFSGPLDAGATALLLHEADFAITIKGNHDRQLLEPANMDAWDREALPALSTETLAWIAALPSTAIFADVFLCHASPQDDQSLWLETGSPDGTTQRAPYAAIAARAAEVSQSVMLCGHTHTPRAVHLKDGRLIVNPGSVGCPGFSDADGRLLTGTPFASYAILEQHRTQWAVNHRLIPYDTAAAIALAHARGYSDWVQALSSGWID
jgi:putative phosphoesterase